MKTVESHLKISLFLKIGFKGFLHKIGVRSLCVFSNITKLFPIKQNGKDGYIDETGKMVIKAKYNYAGYFYEGLAAVRINRKYGYIDTTGQLVIQPQFDYANSYQKGLAAVEIDGKLGYCIFRS